MLFLGKKKRTRYSRRNQQRPGQSLGLKERGGSKLFQSFRAWAAQVDWGKRRIQFVIILFAFLWGGLWLRAWQLQMLDGPNLAARARRQHMAAELVSGKRGMIYDRNGLVLARSVEARSVYANPRDVEDIARTASVLAPILGVDPAAIRTELASTKRFVWLKRKVDDHTAVRIREAALPGIGLSREYDRFYPFGHMAGQLLGFVGMDDKGLEGVERSLDSRLGAIPVRQMVQRDAMGRRFYLNSEAGAEPTGEDVTLTLDMQLQFIAEEAIAHAVNEYKAAWGGAMIVEVASGDILAWAQYPFFNPNSYRTSSPEIYKNRLASDALEPGSTFKPFIMAAALQERKVTPNTLIDCEGGKWETRKFVIRDTSLRQILPASKVLRYSSNIGMAKIGQSLGAQTSYRYLHDLGFGEPSPIPISSSKGILRKPREWGEVDIMSAAFGQSVSVTVVQMAQAYLTLLNHGMYKPLRLLVEDHNVEEAPRRVFSERTVRAIMDMMRDVVEESDGTGKRARIPGMEVAGKTGTAQKADRKTRTYGRERLASFVGFFPAADPQFLICIFVDEPTLNQFGGVVAAPAFSQIGSRLLTHLGELNECRIADAGAPAQAKGRKRGFKLSAAANQPWLAASASPAQASSPVQMDLPGKLSRPSAQVPDVRGKSVRNAVELFARAGIVPELKGSGARVVRQSPPAGTPWPKVDTDYVLWLSER